MKRPTVLGWGLHVPAGFSFPTEGTGGTGETSERC